MDKQKIKGVSYQAMLGIFVVVIAVIALTSSILPAKADSKTTPEKKTSKPESIRGFTLKDWNLLAK